MSGTSPHPLLLASLDDASMSELGLWRSESALLDLVHKIDRKNGGGVAREGVLLCFCVGMNVAANWSFACCSSLLEPTGNSLSFV